VVVVVAVAVLDGTSSGLAPSTTSRTFVSLLWRCAPGSNSLIKECKGPSTLVEGLDLFSLSDGRRIATLAPVPSGSGVSVDAPAGAASGLLLLTSTTPAPCTVKGAMECDTYVPDSCRNTVLRMTPSQPTPTPLFTVSGALTIGAAIPSPDGSQAAYTAQPCTGTHPAPRLYVRDLGTGLSRPIVTTNFCSSIGRPAWNAAGTELVFPFQPSNDRPVNGGLAFGGLVCAPGDKHGFPRNDPRLSDGWDLAIAAAAATMQSRNLRLITPARGCDFDAAVFDATGIAALEGCSKQGHTAYVTSANLGDAYILQYDDAGHLGTRIKLPYRGLMPGLIATEPGTGKLLVTQDQPEDVNYPDYDRIYELDGTRLRAVARYQWGPEILAVPW
jgi:hypothetical protein